MPKLTKASAKKKAAQEVAVRDADDWGYMARPLAVSNGSKPAPRLDDIHGLISDKINAITPAFAPPPIPAAAAPPANWAKAACALSIVTLIFSLSQSLWMQRQTIMMHEAGMEQAISSIEKLNATVVALKEELKKK